MLRIILLFAAALSLSACVCNTKPDSLKAADSKRLAAALAAQPADVQARYVFRNPQQTLEFFGIKPGMTVLEVLPGQGWYTKVLLPYLGAEGNIIAASYPKAIWPMFGFFSEEQIKTRSAWLETWPTEADAWRDDKSAAISSVFEFGSMPENIKGTADAVLFIRALHNLKRFEKDTGFLTTALANAYDALKPGGIVGVVQHHARENMSDEWAGGANGYIKKGALIETMKAAGFEYVDSSDINVNPKDQPTEQDFVWRLAPVFFTSKDKPELKAKLASIGESHRMTLKFRKPK